MIGQNEEQVIWMTILITGAQGQLGKQLVKKLSPSHKIVGLRRNELDITQKDEVERIIYRVKPDLIIHAAAYTAVDQCENEQKKAFEVNGLGAGYVAQAAARIEARMFYISSDYVFDGKNMKPYNEDDGPNPLSVYGMSKWLGEELVKQLNNGTIIRTSWLYGHDGKNFVKTMLDLGKRNKEIKVVNDQIGSPTYVNDLVDTIIPLLNKKNGIYHVSNTGSCSWYDFAKAIFQEAGFNQELIQPITTKEYGAAALRPSYSVLGQNSLAEENIKSPRHWREALNEFIRKEIHE